MTLEKMNKTLEAMNAKREKMMVQLGKVRAAEEAKAKGPEFCKVLSEAISEAEGLEVLTGQVFTVAFSEKGVEVTLSNSKGAPKAKANGVAKPADPTAEHCKETIAAHKTKKEAYVALVEEGFSQSGIARALGIEAATVGAAINR